MEGRLGLADVAVLTITRAEAETAKQVFGATHRLGGFYYALPKSSSPYSVVLRQAADRGNTPAYEAVKDFVEDLRPRFILLIGTAGGVSTRDRLKVGDVVVPSYIHYGDFQKMVDGKQHPRHLPFDYPSVLFRETYARGILDDGNWYAGVSEKRPTKGKPAVHLDCSLVAGERIWGDPDNAEQIAMLNRFEDASALDMESMGVARAAFSVRRDLDYNLLYGVVRGICDYVDKPNNDRTRKKWTPYASSVAALFGHRVVAEMLKNESTLQGGSS